MENCIACGNSHILNEGKIEGYIKNSFYNIFLCLDCDTKWVSPHVEDFTVYNLIYSKKDTPGYMRYNDYSEEIIHSINPLRFLKAKEEMYYGVIKSIDKEVKNGGTVLDVGCGLGYMTYALVKGGYKATGLDISDNAVKEASKRYGNYFLCKDFFSFNGTEGGYDAICMLELIEHVSDPKKYIEHAITLLNPKGILILTTPNRSWYPHGSLWETDLPPVHLTWFSEKGIELLVKKLNFSLYFFSFSFYNIFYGTVRKPLIVSNFARESFFTENGTPLYPRYTKSRIRLITEKIYIYKLLKTFQLLIYKCGEFLEILLSPNSLCLKRTAIICAVIKKSDN